MKEPPLKHGCFMCITSGAFWNFVGFPLIHKFAYLSPHLVQVQLTSNNALPNLSLR